MKYEEYISFVTIDATEYSHMATGLGLEDGVFPALALHNPPLGQVFPFDQRRVITQESVDNFVLDIVQGNIQPGASGAGKERVAHTDL